MIRLLFVSIFALLFSYSCTDKKLSGKSNTYEMIELSKTDDCSVYAMKFKSGSETLLKLNTSGLCSNIESQQILNAFERTLSDNAISKSTEVGNGKVILLEYPSRLDLDIVEVLSLTERILQKDVSYETNSTNGSTEQIRLTIGK